MEAWTEKDKPNVGQWYRMRGAEQDFLRIRKDYRNQELKQTFWRLDEFTQGDTVARGLTLNQARDYIKQFTWKKGY